MIRSLLRRWMRDIGGSPLLIIVFFVPVILTSSLGAIDYANMTARTNEARNNLDNAILAVAQNMYDSSTASSSAEKADQLRKQVVLLYQNACNCSAVLLLDANKTIQYNGYKDAKAAANDKKYDEDSKHYLWVDVRNAFPSNAQGAASASVLQAVVNVPSKAFVLARYENRKLDVVRSIETSAVSVNNSAKSRIVLHVLLDTSLSMGLPANGSLPKRLAVQFGGELKSGNIKIDQQVNNSTCFFACHAGDPRGAGIVTNPKLPTSPNGITYEKLATSAPSFTNPINYGYDEDHVIYFDLKKCTDKDGNIGNVPYADANTRTWGDKNFKWGDTFKCRKNAMDQYASGLRPLEYASILDDEGIDVKTYPSNLALARVIAGGDEDGSGAGGQTIIDSAVDILNKSQAIQSIEAENVHYYVFKPIWREAQWPTPQTVYDVDPSARYDRFTLNDGRSVDNAASNGEATSGQDPEVVLGEDPYTPAPPPSPIPAPPSHPINDGEVTLVHELSVGDGSIQIDAKTKTKKINKEKIDIEGRSNFTSVMYDFANRIKLKAEEINKTTPNAVHVALFISDGDHRRAQAAIGHEANGWFDPKNVVYGCSAVKYALKDKSNPNGTGPDVTFATIWIDNHAAQLFGEFLSRWYPRSGSEKGKIQHQKNLDIINQNKDFPDSPDVVYTPPVYMPSGSQNYIFSSVYPRMTTNWGTGWSPGREKNMGWTNGSTKAGIVNQRGRIYNFYPRKTMKECATSGLAFDASSTTELDKVLEQKINETIDAAIPKGSINIIPFKI